MTMGEINIFHNKSVDFHSCHQFDFTNSTLKMVSFCLRKCLDYSKYKPCSNCTAIYYNGDICTIGTVAYEGDPYSSKTKANLVKDKVKICKYGWWMHNDKCYYLGDEKFNYTEAKGYCNSVGGKLSNEMEFKDETCRFTKNYTASLRNGNCYRYYINRTNFTNAQASCKQKDGVLYSMKKYEDYHKITGLARYRYYDSWQNGQKINGLWKWEDENNEVNYTNWYNHTEPNGGRTENCAYLHYTRMHSSRCTNKFRFACEYYVDVQENCPENTTFHVGYKICLEFIDKNLTFYSARQDCLNKSGDLISIKTWEKMRFIPSKGNF